MTREEAINTLRNIYQTDKMKEALSVLIPELRESEDERMQISFNEPYNPEDYEVVMEGNATSLKRKEQKPISTEDMPYVTDERFYEREPKDSFKYKLAEYMTKCCTKKEGPYGYTYGISSESILQMAKEELIKRGELKEQKSAEWSEEDEKILDDVSHILIGLNYKQIAKDYKQAIKKLIYARPSWKPSKEEMQALDVACSGKLWYGDIYLKGLKRIRKQLEKLM